MVGMRHLTRSLLACRGPLSRSAGGALSHMRCGIFDPCPAAAASAFRSFDSIGGSRRSFAVFSSDADYVTFASRVLDSLEAEFEALEEALDIEELTCSDGVLLIDLGVRGKFVINRHIPNKQIWYSSPISGPSHYDYNPESNSWIDTRGGPPFHRVLSDQMSSFMDTPVNFASPPWGDEHGAS